MPENKATIREVKAAQNAMVQMVVYETDDIETMRESGCHFFQLDVTNSMDVTDACNAFIEHCVATMLDVFGLSIFNLGDHNIHKMSPFQRSSMTYILTKMDVPIAFASVKHIQMPGGRLVMCCNMRKVGE